MPYALQRQGDEFLVNSLVDESQLTSHVAALSGGGFLVTWIDGSGDGHDTSWYGIRGQRFDAQGVKVGDEFGINTTTFGVQLLQFAAPLTDGRFVVTWTDTKVDGFGSQEADVRGQIFNADGTKAGSEFVVTTVTDNTQTNGGIVALAGGGFVATWADSGGSTRAIKAQVFDESGAKVGDELFVSSSTTDFVSASALAALTSGRFVATFVSKPSNGPATVDFQIFDTAGNKIGAQRPVSQPGDNDVFQTNVAALHWGFVVTWAEESSPSGAPTQTFVIKAQIFDAGGGKVGSEILVDPTPTEWEVHGLTALSGGGGFVVTWSRPAGDGTNDIHAQVYSATGSKLGGEVTVNGITAGMQMQPEVVALTSGELIITWSDNSASGGGESSTDIKAQLLSFLTEASSGDDLLMGTADSDEIAGLGGNDEIYGLGGSDLLEGNEGDDVIYGGDGHDTITGGDGVDALYGDAGDDMVQSHFESNGYHDIIIDGGDGWDTLELSAGNFTGFIGIDINFWAFNQWIWSIEYFHFFAGSGGSLVYSGFFNDQLHGGSGVDEFYGGGGDDFLSGAGGSDYLGGGGGADYLDGGEGADFLDGQTGDDTYIVDNVLDEIYEEVGDSNDRVHSSISYALGTDWEIETLSTTDDAGNAAIDLTGNEFSQSIIGNDGSNILTGGLGDDALNGRAGLDTAVFSGLRSGAAVSRTGATITGVNGADGNDSLTGIERLEFADGTMKFAFHTSEQWGSVAPGGDVAGWHVGDFDGDLKDDIFRYVEGTSGAQMFLSDGSGFDGGIL